MPEAPPVELVPSRIRVARPAPSKPSPPSLAMRLRDERSRRNLSVRELARLADCSPSLVSQVERGRANPSVSTLYALSDALEISVASLFETSEQAEAVEVEAEPGGPSKHGLSASQCASDRPRHERSEASKLEASVVLRRANRRAIQLERDVYWELLTPAPERGLEFLEVRYDPQGGSAAKEHAIHHQGRDLALILEGVLSAQIGFDQYELYPGDSIAFEATVPHRFWNAGTVPVRAIFVVLGRCEHPPAGRTSVPMWYH